MTLFVVGLWSCLMFTAFVGFLLRGPHYSLLLPWSTEFRGGAMHVVTLTKSAIGCPMEPLCMGIAIGGTVADLGRRRGTKGGASSRNSDAWPPLGGVASLPGRRLVHLRLLLLLLHPDLRSRPHRPGTWWLRAQCLSCPKHSHPEAVAAPRRAQSLDMISTRASGTVQVLLRVHMGRGRRQLFQKKKAPNPM